MNVPHWATLVCALACAASTHAAELGRLFFTPAQRATLDSARKQNIRIEVGSDSEQPPAPVPQHIRIMGLVQRSDGKSTVWVNNRIVTEQQPSGAGIAVTANKKDSGVKLTVPESGRSVDLKVGQTVEVLSGAIAEGYVHRVPTKPMEKSAPPPESAARGELIGPKAPARRDEAPAPSSAQPQATRLPER